MSRVSIQPQAVPAASQPLLDQIQQAFGATPNMFKAVSKSPAALQSMWGFFGALGKGTLGARLGEQIAVAIANANRCEYCLAAHTLMAKKAGFSSEQIHALRRGAYAEETQLDALVKFAQTLVTTTGTLPEADVAALRNAGFSDQQVIEIISAISAILFTNMVNRVNDTVVDFPKAD